KTFDIPTCYYAYRRLALSLTSDAAPALLFAAADTLCEAIRKTMIGNSHLMDRLSLLIYACKDILQEIIDGTNPDELPRRLNDIAPFVIGMHLAFPHPELKFPTKAKQKSFN